MLPERGKWMHSLIEGDGTEMRLRSCSRERNISARSATGNIGPANVYLTSRERKCLLWAARGKTAWETAMILANSESAVKKHLAAAAAKLDARTRTQAVVIALVRGLIQP